ncbi:MAG: hypothetical protein J2P26_02380, partial [Nocardiopsaceae bacterium]|nr:hypothetical protein [Nocardiopsaceae bacterium]
HATHITQKELTIGGVPGLRTSYQVTSSAIGTAYGSQLEVLPKADKACFVTLTTLDPRTEDAILGQAATTAQFP